jgi:hypothetical protein
MHRLTAETVKEYTLEWMFYASSWMSFPKWTCDFNISSSSYIGACIISIAFLLWHHVSPIPSLNPVYFLRNSGRTFQYAVQLCFVNWEYRILAGFTPWLYQGSYQHYHRRFYQDFITLLSRSVSNLCIREWAWGLIIGNLPSFYHWFLDMKRIFLRIKTSYSRKTNRRFQLYYYRKLFESFQTHIVHYIIWGILTFIFRIKMNLK